MSRVSDLRARFLAQHHADEILVMPNPFDVGSAKLLQTVGAPALATTSSGLAASVGQLDQTIGRDELVVHVEALVNAVDIPINVDAEDCFSTTVKGVERTAGMIAATGAAGFSIEDYDRKKREILPVKAAAKRVAAAKAAGGDLVLTARAENHLYGVRDFDDTIERLIAYRDAGADVLYAPGVVIDTNIRRLVEAVEAPVNILALPGTPPVPALAELGVARVSVGGLFAWAAYGAVVTAAEELFGPGTHTYVHHALRGEVRQAAFS